MAVHVGVRGPGHLSRTFGWSPSQLGASLLGWWDAEDASTITQSGGLVSSWKDKVAAYDAVQATGASKPVYSATSYNSRPGITFDGVDDELTYAGVGAFPTGASLGEVWVLTDQTALVADATSRFAVGYGDISSLTHRGARRAVSGGVNRFQYGVGDGVGAQLASPAGDFSGRHVVRGQLTATDVVGSLDGTAATAAANAGATGTTRTRIGAATAAVAASFWQGTHNTVLITSALSAGQAAQVLAYLKTRGGIA